MTLPDGEFPSTGASAKRSPHNSLRDNQAPRVDTRHPHSSLIVEWEIFVASIFYKILKKLFDK